MKQSVEVEIAGQKLVIRTDEGPAYVHELADYVDAQLRQLVHGPGGAKSGDRRGTLNVQRVALLVAIQLADELFREKDLHRQFRQRMSAKLDALQDALDEHEARLSALSDP